MMSHLQRLQLCFLLLVERQVFCSAALHDIATACLGNQSQALRGPTYTAAGKAATSIMMIIRMINEHTHTSPRHTFKISVTGRNHT